MTRNYDGRLKRLEHARGLDTPPMLLATCDKNGIIVHISDWPGLDLSGWIGRTAKELRAEHPRSQCIFNVDHDATLGQHTVNGSRTGKNSSGFPG